MTKKRISKIPPRGRKAAERAFRAAVRSAERVGAPAIPKHTRAAVAKMKIGELRAEAAALRRTTKAIERTMIQNAGNMGAHDAYAEIIKLMPTEKGKDKLRDLESDDVFEIAKELVNVAPEYRKGAIGRARRKAERKAAREFTKALESSEELKELLKPPTTKYLDLPPDKYDGLDF